VYLILVFFGLIWVAIEIEFEGNNNLFLNFYIVYKTLAVLILSTSVRKLEFILTSCCTCDN